MKKILSLLLVLSLSLGLAACGNANSSEVSEFESAESATITELGYAQ